jgi:pantoate--beta-alanine ligase
MHIIYTLDEMTETARGWLSGGTVGFVPTMGYLHEGHLSLIRAAQADCEISVVSIFVNPLQFRSQEDFQRYPRNLGQDLRHLRALDVDVVFLPHADEMYPTGFATYVQLEGPLAEQFEAARNPRFVRGIATDAIKQLNLIRPDVAYFGQKDAQQVALLRQLVRDLGIDVQLRVLPTVRETDGLAMSSRNHLLSSEQRQAAPVLYQALLAGKAAVERGERDVGRIKQEMSNVLASHPLITLDYLTVCHPDTFVEYSEIKAPALLALSAALGDVHLIDNIVWMNEKQWRV